MTTVSYHGATRSYKEVGKPAVDHLDLHIADGEFLVLVGPSGCGKTTTLRMLAGLETVDDGSIYIGDVNVTNIPPSQRDIAMVFQNYALYPHMTVAENIGFHLKITKTPKSEIKMRVAAVAALLDLTAYLDRKPGMLSGGQRQRVAMGRAIIRSPQVFLMDEPLSNLDAKLRVQTRTHIAELQQRLQTTTVYVTHDQVEAMTLGHRVAILKEGVLQQVDTPATIYRKPHNIFVASFIGSPAMNLLYACIINGNIMVGEVAIPVPREIRTALNGDAIVVGIRSENFHIAAEGISVRVKAVEKLGADSFLYCTGDFSVFQTESKVPVPGEIAVRTPGLTSIVPGTSLVINYDLAAMLFFDPATGNRLEG